MALYAANNILRGIRNYDGDTYARVAGIIYNERKVSDEDERVKRFAKAVGLPICVKVPRSNAFAKAEEQNSTLTELNDYPTEQAIFKKLATQIGNGLTLYKAKPLEDDELEQVVLGIKPVESKEKVVQSTTEEISVKTSTISKPTTESNRPPLYGCAFNGAATTAINLKDALVIAHSPKACAFYTWQNITSPGRKNLFNRGILMPSALSPNFECTNMEQSDVVFGGVDRLKQAVNEAIKRKPSAIIIISSCVSGIIGDDIKQLEELSTNDLPIITIPADGDIAGDYMEGIKLCMHTLATKLINPQIKPKGKSINIIGEAGVSNNLETNYRILKPWMDAMGIHINCRFLGEATCNELKNFLVAPLNVLASDSPDCRNLRDWLSKNYECTFMDEVLPIGFEDTKNWLLKLGEFFDCTNQANKLIANEEAQYTKRIEDLKPYLKGKRLFITTINTNMDWLLDVVQNIGIEVVFIGVLNYLHQPVKVTNSPKNYRIDETFNGLITPQMFDELHPDIIISNYVTQPEDDSYIVDSTPMIPRIGFYSGIEIAERWVKLLNTTKKGGWMNDEILFKKYFS
ncbi:Nitrogenase (molybdenum-iron) reductase and maturation protein NifH / Nitrogenase FeMo-cofactor scaffold and assembly protein NifE [Lachnospiraceae bacterium TWA4]|nr:Nitrogenase (molybdenum-iron) reductase and maturation protein NifH / Nitrogenase FeMo-cofactor scaffold and assembly protein NifE [Lachnospiraceae bacterium TWA4]